MKILVLNRGSSSIKCSIYQFSKLPNSTVDPIWEDAIDGKEFSNLKDKIADKEIDCIGHRIVHGGTKHQESILINSEVKKDIAKLSDLAPLHNLEDLEGIEILEKLFPKIPQIAVFDTAFHNTIPLSHKVYPGPYKWFENGIQRFGFHGISFQYCTQRSSEMLGRMPHKMVICHLGSGASLCAVKDGKSIDTTMGFTPLEGLMMDTRSGSIDPGILLYLLKDNKKTMEELSHELYERSGLLGLSGISSDMRKVLEKAHLGDFQANLAIEVYIHRLTSCIGSMVASLGGLDTLIFTAGIGENAPLIREKTCSRLSFLGIKLRKKKLQKKDVELSSSDSKVTVLLIHTQEAFEIAKECWKLGNK